MQEKCVLFCQKQNLWFMKMLPKSYLYYFEAIYITFKSYLAIVDHLGYTKIQMPRLACSLDYSVMIAESVFVSKL